MKTRLERACGKDADVPEELIVGMLDEIKM